MRAMSKWILAFGLVAAAGSAARPAEPEKAVPKEGAIQLMLLRQKAVQEDLKLTKDQVDKIDTFGDAQWKKAEEIHKMEADKKLEGDKVKAEFAKLSTANEKFITDTLKADQTKRLDQISLQVAGLLWVLDPKVSKALGITPAQETKIKDLHKAAHTETQAVTHGDLTGAAREAKLDELRAAHRKALMDVLTDDQKTKWKELAGEPLKGKLVFISPNEKK
jgi:Spy/CpxP family protein refolding chaperone